MVSCYRRIVASARSATYASANPCNLYQCASSIISNFCITPVEYLARRRYLMKNDNKTGPGSIQSDTVALYFHHPNFGVKELHSLSRIPYTLVCAVEFITAPVQAEQAAALEELRRMVIRCAAG